MGKTKVTFQREVQETRDEQFYEEMDKEIEKYKKRENEQGG